jgi:hypothetical protein
MAQVLAGAGDLEKARQVAVQAEAAARSITDPDRQAWALTEVTEALIRAGDLGGAEAAARSITDPDRQAWALTEVVEALAVVGGHNQAENGTDAITDPTKIAVMRKGSGAATEHSRQLLASALAQTRKYDSLLPCLAKVEPTAVIAVAQDLFC